MKGNRFLIYVIFKKSGHCRKLPITRLLTYIKWQDIQVLSGNDSEVVCFIKDRQCVQINKQGETEGVKIEREAKRDTKIGQMIGQILAQSGSNGRDGWHKGKKENRQKPELKMRKRKKMKTRRQGPQWQMHEWDTCITRSESLQASYNRVSCT